MNAISTEMRKVEISSYPVVTTMRGPEILDFFQIFVGFY